MSIMLSEVFNFNDIVLFSICLGDAYFMTYIPKQRKLLGTLIRHTFLPSSIAAHIISTNGIWSFRNITLWGTLLQDGPNGRVLCGRLPGGGGHLTRPMGRSL